MLVGFIDLGYVFRVEGSGLLGFGIWGYGVECLGQSPQG